MAESNHSTGIFGVRIMNRETSEEVPLPAPSHLFVSPMSEGTEQGRVYTLADALEGLGVAGEITGSAACDFMRALHRWELKRYVTPLSYRVQPHRSQTVKIAGMYLNSKAAFMQQLLNGKE